MKALKSAQQPAADKYQLISLFISMRRMIRNATHRRDALSQQIRLVRRRIDVLSASKNPFDHRRCEVLDASLRRLKGIRRDQNDHIHRTARLLVDLAPMLDLALSLPERCDLLNINTVDRHDLHHYEGVINLIFLRGLEDSATFRERNTVASPLFKAVRRIIFEDLAAASASADYPEPLYNTDNYMEYMLGKKVTSESLRDANPYLF